MVKVSYNVEFEAEDIAKLVDLGFKTYDKIKKGIEDEMSESDSEEIKDKLGQLDTKLDGLEAQIKDFKEVDTKSKK